MDNAHGATVGIQGNVGMPAIGRSLDVDCPVCHVSRGVNCGGIGPSHVDRGRIARYAVMGIPRLDN